MVVNEVEDVIQRIAGSLPDGAAKLDIHAGDAPGGTNLILTPSNAAAAPIHVYVEEDSAIVYLTIGLGGIFEVPLEGRRYTDLSYLDEIRAICLAAIRGDFEETVWFKGGEVVAGTAKAKIGSGEVGDSWRQLFTSPFRRRTKKSFVYGPYV